MTIRKEMFSKTQIDCEFEFGTLKKNTKSSIM